jgi:hypothetical protein
MSHYAMTCEMSTYICLFHPFSDSFMSRFNMDLQYRNIQHINIKSNNDVCLKIGFRNLVKIKLENISTKTNPTNNCKTV